MTEKPNRRRGDRRLAGGGAGFQRHLRTPLRRDPRLPAPPFRRPVGGRAHRADLLRRLRRSRPLRPGAPGFAPVTLRHRHQPRHRHRRRELRAVAAMTPDPGTGIEGVEARWRPPAPPIASSGDEMILEAVRYAAVGGPNQAVSASGRPGSAGSPTQATYPSGRISTAGGSGDRAEHRELPLTLVARVDQLDSVSPWSAPPALTRSRSGIRRPSSGCPSPRS